MKCFPLNDILYILGHWFQKPIRDFYKHSFLNFFLRLTVFSFLLFDQHQITSLLLCLVKCRPLIYWQWAHMQLMWLSNLISLGCILKKKFWTCCCLFFVAKVVVYLPSVVLIYYIILCCQIFQSKAASATGDRGL